MAGSTPSPGNTGDEAKSFRPPLADVDLRALAASQRKNADAIVQISQLALDGMQQAWRRQLDFVREAVEEMSTFVVELGESDGSLDRRLARQADYSKQSFERVLLNAREFTELTTRAANEAMSLVSQRLTEGLDEIRRVQERRAS